MAIATVRSGTVFSRVKCFPCFSSRGSMSDRADAANPFHWVVVGGATALSRGKAMARRHNYGTVGREGGFEVDRWTACLQPYRALGAGA
jgi:hypothetical protein